jgi:hypothetical protein
MSQNRQLRVSRQAPAQTGKQHKVRRNYLPEDALASS